MPRHAGTMAPTSQDPRHDPLLGRLLAGRYRVEALIEKGGMGKVYRATQEPLGRPVALKTLDLTDPRGEFKQRFLNEAAVQGRLTHPNSVRMFDYGRTEDGIYFITMELLRGESLKQVVRREAPLPPKRVVHIAIQICRALHEAHELGVVHRDLKPGNIFLTQHGDQSDHVKVIDFGLVKDLHAKVDVSHTGQTLGSPMYMAPEQVEGDPVDRRTDVYALGLVLFVALSGRAPYPRGSVATVMMHQVTMDVPAFEDVGIDVAPELEALVRDCIEKQKSDRPDSMRVVEQRLLALQDALEDYDVENAATVLARIDNLPQLPAKVDPEPADTSSESRVSAQTGFSLAALALTLVAVLGAVVLALVGLGGGSVALWALFSGAGAHPGSSEGVDGTGEQVLEPSRFSQPGEGTPSLLWERGGTSSLTRPAGSDCRSAKSSGSTRRTLRCEGAGVRSPC